MAHLNEHTEDLEEGEIESEEETCNEEVKEETSDAVKAENTNDGCVVEENVELNDIPDRADFFPKLHKKKKFKFGRSEKFKQKKKKNKISTNANEEDFASTVEKAIRKVMSKNEDGHKYEEDNEYRKEKRKRKNSKEDQGRKRPKRDYSEEMDETEMLCVRGASPVLKNSPQHSLTDHEKDSFYSDSSVDSKNFSPRNKCFQPRERSKNGKERKRMKLNNPMQESGDVCVYFMQGKCPKGEDCAYSHDAQPPRKMELCKFYLMDCCAKRDKCLYMHSDFPCKYYHTGLPCIFKDECKFAHGEPLTENLRNILLKHIESAPKEILGDFPRLNRDGAMKMIQTMQMRLTQQFTDKQEKTIPSLFDINVPPPEELLQSNHFTSERQNKTSPKIRQSRWQNDDVQTFSNKSPNNILSIKNLTGVLTPRQIADLTKMGIENLDQLSQLTVLQLNNIGISLKQITDIQLNTINIQKLGLISNNIEQSSSNLGLITNSKDMDLRVPPFVSTANDKSLLTDLPEKDVDMRFHSSVAKADVVNKESNDNLKPYKDMIDIDQYTKDALKFVAKDKENILVSEAPQNNNQVISNETKDVDHRVLSFTESEGKTNTLLVDSLKKEYDTDIRFLQPEPLFKNPAKRSRLSTTDDDDENNLFIDEKWYSSDEEKMSKKKSPLSSPQPHFYSPQGTASHTNEEASSVVTKLGDLSKIDISAEVTKLLNSMKNKATNDKLDIQDPEKNTLSYSHSNLLREKSVAKKQPRVSIYECIDGEPTDGRRRADVDLRKSDFLPALGDMDLRQSSSGDIDFRLGLPFKPIPNYTPASEIDGSVNSHPPIPYKLIPIHIPRPDYTDIKNSTAKSQALLDPRLRKVFRLSIEESYSDTEKPTKTITSSVPREDPRKNRKNSTEVSNSDEKSLDLQTILQNSSWYKDLSSTHKIFVNQNLAPVTLMLKQYQIEKNTGKPLDLGQIRNNPILCSIFGSLGIIVTENGEYKLLPKPKEPLLKTPPNFVPNSNLIGMNPSLAGPSNLIDTNVMNLPSMGINNGPVPNFNHNFQEHSSGPTHGLLGIAPNMPHNFPGPFVNPGLGMEAGANDFPFMNGDPMYRNFANRGGHRGRGNDRWNRGGPDRSRNRNNDRNTWKRDRT